MAATSDRIVRYARPIAVAAATAAWVISAFLNNLKGWELAGTLAGGAVLTALAVGLPMVAERRSTQRAATAEQIAENAEARMQLVLDDALDPLVYLIAGITDRRGDWSRRERSELQGQAKLAVLSSAARVLGADRLRACFFALDTTGTRLTPAGFHGRAEQPRSSFTARTDLGDFVLAALAGREDLFYADVHVAAPPGWRPEGHAYRTFLAVPVATEERVFGLLTIDGLGVGDLTESDVAPARVFARLLAVALNS